MSMFQSGARSSVSRVARRLAALRRLKLSGGAVLSLSLSLSLWGGCGAAGPGGTGGPGDPTPMQSPGTTAQLGQKQTGDGTYYGATGGGACSYDPSPGNLMVAAMNAPQYQNSQACGTCIDVTGPKGTITIRIVDLCPECKSGDLDLSEQAFVLIADKAAGRVPISWVPVACQVSGPISIRFKEGSSQWWMAVQVRNSKLPIKKIELQKSGSWVALEQQSYNYYVMSSMPGPGPFTFRITSTTDQQITESGVVLKDAQVVQGTQQF
ncbi:MAG: expansin EXLX1 family cellulose-binding protein [Polyangia bacterium]